MHKPPPGVAGFQGNNRAGTPANKTDVLPRPGPQVSSQKQKTKSPLAPVQAVQLSTPVTRSAPPVYRPMEKLASSAQPQASPTQKAAIVAGKSSPHLSRTLQLSKYIPPSRRAGATASAGMAYRPPGKAGQLAAWLDNTPNLQVYRVFGIKPNGDQVVELGQRIRMDGQFRCVRYNIHNANTAHPILGSIWMEGIGGVSVNAQDNPKRATLVAIWRAALAPPAPAPPAPEIDISGFFD